MKNWMSMIVIMFAASASPCAFGGHGGDAAAGKDVFTKRCAMCHGADASGNTPMAKALGAMIPDYRSKTVQDMTDADIKKQITQGKDKIPAQLGLRDGDIANLVAYIRTFGKK